MSTSSKDATATTDQQPNTSHLRRRVTQNFLLIWMDGNIDQSNQDFTNTFNQLRIVINDINIFTQPDECVDFLTEVDSQKAFMIVTATIGQQILPLIHDIPQLDTIYVLCDNQSTHQELVKQWPKIRGVYTEITSIYEPIKKAVRQCDENSIPISFIAVDGDASTQDFNRLEPSFIYTQIFKDILLEMQFDQQSVKNFTTYCRDNDCGSKKDIDDFESKYLSHSPIWWYTSKPFVFSTINRALRTLESDTIINMGFFIRDLHQKIKELHRQQVNTYYGQPSIVYRGQGLSTEDFEKLLKTKGGLMSFNNFLSTSKDQLLSLGFAYGALGKRDIVAILFRISIDSSISTTPFADINEFSQFPNEEEVLFSMHTVFRVEEITKIDGNNPLYQVDLRLTADDDQQLRTLTKHIQEQVQGSEWEKVGQLLISICHFNKAEELYHALLDQTTDENKKSLYYNKLGIIKSGQREYPEALSFYEESLKIRQKNLPENHSDLATSYNNIGCVYENMREFSKALSYYKKSLKISKKTLSNNHSDLGISYNNIGSVYESMREYSKALSNHKKSLKIGQKTLPENHPYLAVSHNNIGSGYESMEEFSKALSCYKKSLDIKRKTLPENHPSLAISYENIGELYRIMEEYSKALSYYEKSLNIKRKTLPENHPSLATPHNNIGLVYDNMGEYSKSILFYEKALTIFQCSPHSNYSNIEIVQWNIECVKKKL